MFMMLLCFCFRFFEVICFKTQMNISMREPSYGFQTKFVLVFKVNNIRTHISIIIAMNVILVDETKEEWIYFEECE